MNALSGLVFPFLQSGMMRLRRKRSLLNSTVLTLGLVLVLANVYILMLVVWQQTQRQQVEEAADGIPWIDWIAQPALGRAQTLTQRQTLQKPLPTIRWSNVPRLVHQLAPSLALSVQQWNYVHSFTATQSSLRHILWTQKDLLALFESLFPLESPRLGLLTPSSLQMDIGRLMILEAFGGLVADIDTLLLKDLELWIPASVFSDPSQEVNLILGLGEEEEEENGQVSWCLSTLGGRAHHPILQRSVSLGLERLKEENLPGSYQRNLSLPLSNASTVTPGTASLWTSSVGLSAAVEEYLAAQNRTSREFKDLSAPVLVGDVLLFPRISFAASLGPSPVSAVIGPDPRTDVLVHHLNKHGGRSIHGEKSFDKESSLSPSHPP